ncbi:unnamed protein product [Zymoseptoria tritici ST99CH_1A5]|uniref:Extracellular membrane protein CFEM domain-containing protein n=2 Tax=Zymoseptoria tritici TaxID=1047171 RepID=A0A1X7RUN1_ZYMT9|nr:unnamed protein product [Zymoseptoria tritici ST99CH_3D7]SMR54646.1 unnamed protein product [Zymoseptoria tritici ST99CH_3D1]SMY24808.1 unnamed protein product [Zymoseptoria tritici ST99CH_1A5]
MKTTLVLSTLLTASAWAAYNVKELKWDPANGGCTDNTDCGGTCANIYCATGQEDICDQRTKKCTCALQNAAPVCLCVIDNVALGWGPLSDACKRGDVIDGKIKCVYNCQDDGVTGGNGGCNLVQDPCKAP